MIFVVTKDYDGVNVERFGDPRVAETWISAFLLAEEREAYGRQVVLVVLGHEFLPKPVSRVSEIELVQVGYPG